MDHAFPITYLMVSNSHDGVISLSPAHLFNHSILLVLVKTPPSALGQWQHNPTRVVYTIFQYKPTISNMIDRVAATLPSTSHCLYIGSRSYIDSPLVCC